MRSSLGDVDAADAGRHGRRSRRRCCHRDSRSTMSRSRASPLRSRPRSLLSSGRRRGASPEPVLLDRRHAAAAVTSERHFRRGDEPAPAGFAPLSRFWKSADGWVRTHANYPWHRARPPAMPRPRGRGRRRRRRAGRRRRRGNRRTNLGRARGRRVRDGWHRGGCPNAVRVARPPARRRRRGRAAHHVRTSRRRGAPRSCGSHRRRPAGSAWSTSLG